MIEAGWSRETEVELDHRIAGCEEAFKIQSGIAGLHRENGKVPQLYQSLYY